VGIIEDPEERIGIDDPLPTTTEFPVFNLVTEWRLPVEEAKCEVAPESMYQFGSDKVRVLNASAKSRVD